MTLQTICVCINKGQRDKGEKSDDSHPWIFYPVGAISGFNNNNNNNNNNTKEFSLGTQG